VADAVAVWAVVVAAGSGERLGAEQPKAFVAFGEDPLVAASVAALDEHPAIDGIVLVVPEGWEERATFMCDEIGAGKVAVAVPGWTPRGASRIRSIGPGSGAPRRRRRSRVGCWRRRMWPPAGTVSAPRTTLLSANASAGLSSWCGGASVP